MPTEEPLPRRPVPGTPLVVSSIALCVAEGPAERAGPDGSEVALLRRAREGGVTTFFVGSRAGEEALARAVPARDPDLVVVADRTPGALANERAGVADTVAERSAALVRSVDATNRHLGPHRVAFVRWSTAGGPGEPAGGLDLNALRSRGVVGVIRTVRPPLDLGSAAPEQGPECYAGHLSLLDRRLEAGLAARAEQRPLGFFAVDPLAAGRLDGRAIVASAAERRPGRPPTPFRELAREFEPVLRLRGLTEGGHRTLPRVAIGFALRHAWVCAAVVDLPTADRLADLLEAGRAPSIPESEWQALDPPDAPGPGGRRLK